VNPDLVQQIEAKLVRAANELADLYSRTALALNALEVTSTHYEARDELLALDTEGRIPECLSLPQERTSHIARDAPLEHYRGVVPQYELENYFI
jgi:hypothetical protein